MLPLLHKVQPRLSLDTISTTPWGFASRDPPESCVYFTHPPIHLQVWGVSWALFPKDIALQAESYSKPWQMCSTDVGRQRKRNYLLANLNSVSISLAFLCSPFIFSQLLFVPPSFFLTHHLLCNRFAICKRACWLEIIREGFRSWETRQSCSLLAHPGENVTCQTLIGKLLQLSEPHRKPRQLIPTPSHLE